MEYFRNQVAEKKISDYLDHKIPNFDKQSWENKKIVYENLVRSCKSCNLRFDTGYSPIPSVINKDCFALFVGRNPCKGEAMTNAIMSSDILQGTLFKKYLSVMGIGPAEYSFINMANCHGKGNRPPTQTEINKCIGFKKLELDLIGNSYKILFPMSNDAMHWVFGLNSPGIMPVLGNVYRVDINGREVVVVPVVHPSQCLIDPDSMKSNVLILKKCKEIVTELRSR